MKIFADMYKPDAKAGRFLSVLALSGIAYGLYKGVQDNYLVRHDDKAGAGEGASRMKLLFRFS